MLGISKDDDGGPKACVFVFSYYPISCDIDECHVDDKGEDDKHPVDDEGGPDGCTFFFLIA